MSKTYQRYDHRLKDMVALSGDIERFARFGIPKSTLRQWLKRGVQNVVSIPELELASSDLVLENLELKHKIESLVAKQDLVSKTLLIFGFQMQYKRLPAKTSKEEIIAAIKSAASIISLTACLDAIGLSAQRYHAWIKRQVTCLLQDQLCCPRVSPTKLTWTEVSKIKQLATSSEFAHYSIT